MCNCAGTLPALKALLLGTCGLRATTRRPQAENAASQGTGSGPRPCTSALLWWSQFVSYTLSPIPAQAYVLTCNLTSTATKPIQHERLALIFTHIHTPACTRTSTLTCSQIWSVHIWAGAQSSAPRQLFMPHPISGCTHARCDLDTPPQSTPSAASDIQIKALRYSDGPPKKDGTMMRCLVGALTTGARTTHTAHHGVS